MKLDPKAISAAIDAFNERQHILAKSSAPYMQAAISAYCEKAGVVMVPREPTWGIEAMSGAGAEQIPAEVGRGEAGAMACNVYRAMIHAYQEGE